MVGDASDEMHGNGSRLKNGCGKVQLAETRLLQGSA